MTTKNKNDSNNENGLQCYDVHTEPSSSFPCYLYMCKASILSSAIPSKGGVNTFRAEVTTPSCGQVDETRFATHFGESLKFSGW